MTPPPIYFVDAFADRPFTGNPAAVCLLDAPAPAAWMQSLAAEINLSETAFIGSATGQPFPLRWFTPTAEVELCGHATLAGAHTLWQTGMVPRDVAIRFSTLSGVLTATWSDGWIKMDFPAMPATEAGAFPQLLEALGITSRPRFFGKTRFDHLIEVESEQVVRELNPDFTRLRELSQRGVMVTSRSASQPGGGTAAGAAGYDFVSRFFAPGVGVNEDPVTGSAHASLGPYWAERLGKQELVAYQASRRGGSVRVRPEGDRVFISGRALTMMRAELAVTPE